MITLKEFIQESLINKECVDAQNLIKTYFQKRNICVIPTISNLTIDDVKYCGNFIFSTKTNKCAYLLWKQQNPTSLDGIVFSSDANGVIEKLQKGEQFNGDVIITLAGCSLADILPLVKEVILGKMAMEAMMLKKYLANNLVFNESLVVEDASSKEVQELKKRKATLFSRIYYNNKHDKDSSELQQEMDEINDKLADIQIKVRRNAIVKPEKEYCCDIECDIEK